MLHGAGVPVNTLWEMGLPGSMREWCSDFHFRTDIDDWICRVPILNEKELSSS